MARDRYDFMIVGGGSAGCALANRLSTDPSTTVLVLEAGRSDYPFDVFVHMPAALTFPSGNPLYDWRYESEPEPHLHGRRVPHARGKVLGGSSSINGMIFQRGNPLDYERWAADPGMGTWDYAHCLPYFMRMENCLAAESDDVFRGHSGPLVLERGPATNPLYGAFLQAAQEAGYPLTDDVNGFRQEGFARFDRNVYRGRRLSAARAYLHPVMSRPNLDVRTNALVTKVVFDGTRAVGVEYARFGRGSAQRVDAGEVVLCGGAINSPQLLQLSGVGEPGRCCAAWASPVVADVPGVGREPPGPPGGLRAARVHAAGVDAALPREEALAGGRRPLAVPAQRARGHQPLRGGRLRPQQRRRRLPEPDVPLPADRGALRRHHARGRGTATRCTSGRCTPTPAAPSQITSTDPRKHPALRFNYLSTDQDRREWVEAVRVTRKHPRPARAAGVRRRGALPRPRRADRRSRSSTGWATTRRRRCTRAAPPPWAPARWRSSTRSRCACAAPRGCASSMRR